MTKKICIIEFCKECGHKYYNNMEGGYYCDDNSVRDQYRNPKYLGWDLPKNIPTWCPLENTKEDS